MSKITPDLAASAVGSGIIINTTYHPANFKLKIIGPAHNPVVHIGKNEVSILGEILDGNYILIDSYHKTIRLYDLYGHYTNAFDWGERGEGEGSGKYCFEKIGVGSQPVSWDGSFRFDLTVVEDRSEPSWRV